MYLVPGDTKIPELKLTLAARLGYFHNRLSFNIRIKMCTEYKNKNQMNVMKAEECLVLRVDLMILHCKSSFSLVVCLQLLPLQKILLIAIIRIFKIYLSPLYFPFSFL